MHETLSDLLDVYAPWKAKTRICTAAQWDQIRPFVEELLTRMDLGQTRGTRRYLTALTALSAFANQEGHSLDVATVLSEPMIEQWVATLPGSQATYRSTLRKVARELGISTPISSSAVAYPARPSAQPYTPAEVAALLAFARALSNQHRQISLRALLALGLGAGLARSALRDVTATSVHRHEAGPTESADDDADPELFVITQGRCVPVLARYGPELEALCALRPTGPLIGTSGKDLTRNHVGWVGERAGTPALNPDRLRATWIVEHLAGGTGLVELITISGLATCDSLSGFLAYVNPPCDHTCHLAASSSPRPDAEPEADQ